MDIWVPGLQKPDRFTTILQAVWQSASAYRIFSGLQNSPMAPHNREYWHWKKPTKSFSTTRLKRNPAWLFPWSNDRDCCRFVAIASNPLPIAAISGATGWLMTMIHLVHPRFNSFIFDFLDTSRPFMYFPASSFHFDSCLASPFIVVTTLFAFNSCRGRCDAIQFAVDRRIFIAGFGLYGSSNGAAEYMVSNHWS